MEYQSGAATLAGVATTTAGVAVLPETGSTPVLTYVAVAAIVTGAMLIALQAGVFVYRRLNR